MASCATPTLQTPEWENGEVEQEARAQRIAYVKTLMRDQERLARVSYRVAVNVVPLCGPRTTFTTGAFLFDWDQSKDEWVDAANEALGINLHMPGIEVLIITPDSPAEKAGLQVGDRIIRLGDWRVPTRQGAYDLFSRRLDDMLRNGEAPVSLRIQRGAEFLTVTLTPVRACDYPTLIQDNSSINAFTDGEKIVVYRGMMRFIRDDDELAMVISHELAHVVLAHVDATIQNAVAGVFVGAVFDVLMGAVLDIDTGGLGTVIGGQIGALAYSKEFEAEADYLGAYMVALAGYDFGKSPDFLRYLATVDPETMDYSWTHPTTPQRALAAEKTVQEIRSKMEAGQPLVPERKVQAVGG